MLKSVLLVSFCLVLVSAGPTLHLDNDSSLTSSLVAKCDTQAINQLISQVASLTSDTLIRIVSSAVASVAELAYCLWPFDLYMCLMSDMEYSILDNIQEIGESLVDYVDTLGPLLKEISDDVIACTAA